jgi:mRNA-degrading endonuclease toxin of MazEF toxin-antitoxin module
MIIKNINFGQLHLVNFDPSTGHEFQGKRPALIIEADNYIKKSNLVTILPLTSNLNNKLPEDIILEKDSQNRLISDSVTHPQPSFACELLPALLP